MIPLRASVRHAVADVTGADWNVILPAGSFRPGYLDRIDGGGGKQHELVAGRMDQILLGHAIGITLLPRPRFKGVPGVRESAIIDGVCLAGPFQLSAVRWSGR